MSITREFWEGDFGRDYTARNRVDWLARVPFWEGILDDANPRSVHEIGCNAGWNLSAIRAADPDIRLSGEEVNRTAIAQARAAGLDVSQPEYTVIAANSIELVFTAGVLIHIAPPDLPAMMRRAVTLSCGYVLAIEYDAMQETEVEYRGHAGKLWKRPYGELYQELGLKVVHTGDAEGFDRCTYWLLRK